MSTRRSFAQGSPEGLGLEFLTVVREKVFALMDAPSRWQMVNGTRRALLEGSHMLSSTARFPPMRSRFAVAHRRRRPKYWAIR